MKGERGREDRRNFLENVRESVGEVPLEGGQERLELSHWKDQLLLGDLSGWQLVRSTLAHWKHHGWTSRFGCACGDAGIGWPAQARSPL